MSNIENYVGELASQEEKHTIQSMLSADYVDPNAKRREILDKEIYDYSVSSFIYSLFNTALKNVRVPGCENLSTCYRDNKDDINAWFSNAREASNGKSIVNIGKAGSYVLFYLPDSYTSIKHTINLGLHYIPSSEEDDEKSDRVRLEICEALSKATWGEQTKYPFVKLAVDFYDDERIHVIDPVIVFGQSEDEKEIELPCDASVMHVVLDRNSLKERSGLDTIRDVLMELFANTKKDDSRKGY